MSKICNAQDKKINCHITFVHSIENRHTFFSVINHILGAFFIFRIILIITKSYDCRLRDFTEKTCGERSDMCYHFGGT